MINLEELEQLEQSEALRIIAIPLVVPTKQEITNNANLDLSFSPLNACYSKPAINEKTGKRQSWRDVRLTIEGEDNLPSKKDWFYLVTDNGFWCKACFSGRGKQVKWLNTFKHETIIGNWIKNRLVESESIEEFWYPDEDKKKSGVVTKEALELYGGSRVYLKKTPKTYKDEKGIDRDVWLISFPFFLFDEIDEWADK
ncbi:restriction endonuclease PLD domain-containing protein [Mycoplasma wenyonii]|uniref:restriction endonuclease PLD domain-containing protein n=1 Tax=Mycoplasma wenyonii TaxID=65123 RepID=UPI0002D4938A|nr:restriction endonuclease PLD domain-containing protein [Mycoplasma wenyonii]